MRTRDIVIGLVILAVVAGAIVWIRRARTTPAPLPTPSIEEKIEKTFNFEIPEDVDRAELKDVSGGGGAGIATRDTVLADLPDPEGGYFYQAWTEKDGKLISLGKMRLAKGGWIFEGSVAGQKVIVSKEKIFDSKIETKILEGSF